MNNLRSSEFSMILYKTSGTMSEMKGNGVFDHVGREAVEVVLLSFMMSFYQFIF